MSPVLRDVGLNGLLADADQPSAGAGDHANHLPHHSVRGRSTYAEELRDLLPPEERTHDASPGPSAVHGPPHGAHLPESDLRAR